MRATYFFLSLTVLLSACGSSTENQLEEKDQADQEPVDTAADKEVDAEADFKDFLDLFEDLSPYLGGEEDFVFSSYYGDMYQRKIETAKPIPEDFKKFIHAKIKSFKFIQEHLDEDHSYYPVYKIADKNRYAVILYYTVPEVPQTRVAGMYYLMYTFDKKGKLLDAYPLAYSGTPLDYGYTSRSARMSALDNVEVFTWFQDKQSDRSKEFHNRVSISNEGKIEEDLEKIHFELLPQNWILATDENGQQPEVFKECGEWTGTLKLEVDGMLNLSMTHFTGQDASVYKVTHFKYDPYERKYEMHISGLNQRGWTPLTLYYDDPEHMSIRVQGFENDREKVYLFVRKSSVDNGSVRVRKRACEQP